MKAGKSLLVLVLDQSSSMGSVRDATISGVNEFVSAQQKIPGECDMVLVKFPTNGDQAADVRIDGFIPLVAFEPLTTASYNPQGMTPLLDATGRTIRQVGTVLATTSESERPERVLFVVQTDGEENVSKEFTFSQVADMVTHQRETYGWQFMFLGAAQDAWEQGNRLGIGRTVSYDNNAGGTKAAFGTAALESAQYRTTGMGLRSEDSDLRSIPRK